MRRDWRAAILLGASWLVDAGCGSVCSGRSASCLDLQVEGAGSYADISIELSPTAPPPASVLGSTQEPIELPVSLRVEPPEGILPSALSCLMVKAGDDGSGLLARAALQIGGSAELGGSGRLSWEDGQRAEATVRVIQLLRKDVTVGGGSGTTYIDFALGDFDKNAHLDIANILTMPGNNYIGLHANDGTPDGVAYYNRVYIGPGLTGVTTGDTNGDGNIDIIMNSPGTGSCQFLVGNGRGMFSGPPNGVNGCGSGFMVSGDFDHDGIADIAALTNNQTTLVFHFGFVTTNFPLTAPKSVTLPSPGRAIASRDLDGDQKDDIIIATEPSDGAVVYYGNDKNGFSLPKLFAVTADPTDSAVGDVNGDGILDIVIPDRNSGVGFVSGQGGRAMTPVSSGGRVYPCNAVSQQVSALADLDNDGFPDLITASSAANGQLSVFSGNGDGTFKPPVAFPGLPNPNKLVAADMDGDGRADVVLGASMITKIAIFYNRSR